MIHVLGDSHASLFTGLHGVCPRVPDDCPQALPGFCVWHLGAYLAYSFGKSRHAVRATARGCVAKMPQNARVLVWMGEIDCRNHVCKHASSAAGIRRTAREVAERYVRAAAAMLRGREVGFVTVPPPTISQHGNQQQPTNGTFAQRRMAAEAFNAGLQRTAKAAGAMVLDLYDLLSDAKGGPNPAFFADGVHADSRCLPLVLDQLRQCGWMRGDEAAMDVARALAMVPPPATAAGLPGGLLDARDARQVLIELAAARCMVATGRARGAGSIAIFGAGQHTRSMGWEPFERLGLRIACVLDDQAPEDGRGQLRGVPLLRPSKSRRGTPAFDVVLISSDAHEDVLMNRAVAVYGSRLAIIPIYSWRDS
jgi:hypothetical protein